jgi:hypothetical protein
MSTIRRWTLCAFLFGAAVSALAQDEIVLGTPLPAAAGQIARIPVFLRDVPGTPLGAGGAPIQRIELSITHSHPNLIAGCLGTTYPNCNLQFVAEGALAAPATSRTLINIDSLWVRLTFDEPLSFTGRLDSIGSVTVALDLSAETGDEVQFGFDRTKTLLADSTGTVEDKELKLVEAILGVKPCPDDVLPGRPSFDFRGTASRCSPVCPCRDGEDVEFTVTSPIDPCDTLTWEFGDGGTANNVSTVRHRFTLPNFSPTMTSVTYTVTATATRPNGSEVSSHNVTIEAGSTACP